jgi:hypothetical protein
MKDLDQLVFLKLIKSEMHVKWDELAKLANIHPRALKTYRMPLSSADHRKLPVESRVALFRVLTEFRAKKQKTTLNPHHQENNHARK